MRSRLRADLGTREKHLSAASHGNPPLEHERPERLWRFGLAVLRHDSLIMQAKTRPRRLEMRPLQ
jgi:hypothetical protein